MQGLAFDSVRSRSPSPCGSACGGSILPVPNGQDSATNTRPLKDAKLAHIQLNSQTACPPRTAVPVNQGCCGRLFHSQHPDRLRSWLRPFLLCRRSAKQEKHFMTTSVVGNRGAKPT